MFYYEVINTTSVKIQWISKKETQKFRMALPTQQILYGQRHLSVKVSNNYAKCSYECNEIFEYAITAFTKSYHTSRNKRVKKYAAGSAVRKKYVVQPTSNYKAYQSLSSLNAIWAHQIIYFNFFTFLLLLSNLMLAILYGYESVAAVFLAI